MANSSIVVTPKKKKVKLFTIINYIIFAIISLIIIIPLFKVFIDSIDAQATYGFNLWPKQATLAGYQRILQNSTIYKPFIISCITTVAGTFLGLLLSTLGAYVLIQFEMPGRTAFSYILLFTMIFNGGMVPTYLTLRDLHLVDTLWAVILPLSINVYNLVLMRNFFEGIPQSLFEAASIDGCSPLKTFLIIVLPLSKAALASIGLMFGVAFWNDYTNFKLYISSQSLYNFQMKLRSMVMESNIISDSDVYMTTLKNAVIIVAIIPFMIIYPFCQKYFVTGVNVGAVKE